MSGRDDKVKGTVDEVKGKAKQAWGDLTDNDEVRSEGQRDEAKGKGSKRSATSRTLPTTSRRPSTATSRRRHLVTVNNEGGQHESRTLTQPHHLHRRSVDPDRVPAHAPGRDRITVLINCSISTCVGAAAPVVAAPAVSTSQEQAIATDPFRLLDHHPRP